jgi:two-component system chemotaxis response regulator CheB
MEERKTLLKKMEEDNLRKGLTRISITYRERKEELQVHIDRLKEVVYATQKQD